MTISRNQELRNYLEKGFKSLGFCAGFAEAGAVDKNISDFCCHWIDKGYHGGMNWMPLTLSLRLDIRKFYPEARTVVALAYPCGKPGKLAPFMAGYAWLPDYHLVIREKLRNFLHKLKENYPEIRFRVTVDTAPVLEKYWAMKAGLGWIGKNTLLITPAHGSWVFLAIIIFNVFLEPDRPGHSSCTDCQECIRACPTRAIVQPYVLDARRCLAYITVENTRELTAEEKLLLKGTLFGCDRCQIVCPFNNTSGKKPFSENETVKENVVLLKKLMKLDEIGFKSMFQGTPVVRIGFKKFKEQTEIAWNYFQQKGWLQ